MTGKNRNPIKFWQEFKKRNVIRVLAIYAGTAFIILQAADMIFPRWGFPEWTVDLVLYLLILGAFVTIILSWIYDLSPEGLVKTEVVAYDSEEEQVTTWKKKQFAISNLIIAILIVVVGILLYPKLFKNRNSPLSGVSRTSIAILPLKIIGENAELNYYASGLVESLTHMLSKIGNIEKSFSVIPSSEMIEAITAKEARKKFGVSLVITGSIQMDQTSRRLILNLIDTKTQKLIRSEKLDYRSQRNLIIQDETISVIVSMLGLDLGSDTKEYITLGGSSLNEANELYLIGQGILREGVEGVKDIDTALDLFDRATKKDSLFALAFAGKGQAYYLKYHFTSDISWIDESLKFNRKAIELNNQDATILRSYANVLIEKGDYEKARSYFQRSMAIDSANFSIYSDMAYLFELTGDLDKAEKNYRKAVQIDPDSHIAHYYLGVFYYTNGRTEEAEKEARKAMDLSPGHLMIMNLLGSCYYQLEQFDEAIEVFEEMLEKDSTQGLAYQNLGAIYFSAGEYRKSVWNYEQAIRFFPRNYNLNGALGRAYLISGNQSMADKAFQKAIELGKRDFTCSDLNLASWFALMGMEDSTDYYLQKCGVGTDPSYHQDSLDAGAAFFIADIYMILGRNQLAYAYLESALKRGSGWFEIKYYPYYREHSGDPEFREMVDRAKKYRDDT